ncbi:mitochondrial carrier domain-containing protein [Lipomyces arxii]|uniref:mitochondrial carrier domain-containing protein n=1 Tax=Lipomyces arxii TaxID=56418 RepID=UPI0034CF10D0
MSGTGQINQLRPYYHRPELTFQDGVPDLAAIGSGNTTGYGGAQGASGTFLGVDTSRADSLLADLDYADYLELPNTSELLRGFTNAVLLRYSSTLIAQPFEVSKMVLQCGFYDRPRLQLLPSTTTASAKKKSTSSKPVRKGKLDDIDTFEADDEEDEDIDYFTTMSQQSIKNPQKTRRAGSASSSSEESASSKRIGRTKRQSIPRVQRKSTELRPDSYQIEIHRPYISGAMGALWRKDGPWGIWRGSNVTFLQNVLFTTFESWLSAFFSAILSIPDSQIVDIAESSHPVLSLVTSITVTTAVTVALAPLDIVRTKLILTPSDAQPRSVVSSLQCLPAMTCPTNLLLPTALLAAVPKFVSRGGPYIIRTKFQVEPYNSPRLYGMLSLAASTIELFVRLPLETVLRRGQLAYVGVSKALVPVGQYDGFFGTLWNIISSEDNGSYGMEGLWRGWRVGMMGIIGTWGFARIRSRTLAYSGREERF